VEGEPTTHPLSPDTDSRHPVEGVLTAEEATMEDPTNDGTSGAVVNRIAEAGGAAEVGEAEEAVSMDTASRHQNNMVEVSKLT